jgi:hypothetical protein
MWLSDRQRVQKDAVLRMLADLGLHACTLAEVGRVAGPLTRVRAMLGSCAGAVVLGFAQSVVTEGASLPATARQRPIESGTALASPWNQLEAGVAFGLGLPVLVMAEPGIAGGIFDLLPADDVYVCPWPPGSSVDSQLSVWLTKVQKSTVDV